MTVTCLKHRDKNSKNSLWEKENNHKQIQLGWKPPLLCKCLLWWAQKGKGCQDFWCQEPSMAKTLSGIRCYDAPAIRSSQGLQPTFKESAGSFDHKQVGDALHVAFNGTLAAAVPFSCCHWVLMLWLVELVTNASKGLKNNAKSTKNKLETLLFVSKSMINHQLICVVRQLLSGCDCVFGRSKAERNLGLNEQKSSRNNRNRKKTAKIGQYCCFLVVFIGLFVGVVDRSLIGLGIGGWSQLEAAAASSFFYLSSFQQLLKLELLFFQIWQRYCYLFER